jgi:uncharacterized protein with beta-barrel porin domain
MGARISLKSAGQMFLWATAISTLSVPLAHAGDLTVSEPRTDPVDTATGDGQGPGTIIIDSEGTITVQSLAAITVNSSHNATNSGEVTNTGTGVAGIFVNTTVVDPDTSAGSALDISADVTNSGIIRALEPVAGLLEDTPLLNSGIIVFGQGTFTGDITNGVGGNIVAGGNSSAGIAIRSEMIGDIANNGSIQVTGKSAFGIMTTGHVTGSITNLGTIVASNHQGTGVYIGGGLDGTFTNSGNIGIGTDSQLTSQDGFNVTRLPALLGRNGVWIASDITGGVLLQGNGLTLSEQAADPEATAVAPFLDSSINVFGQGPGFIVTPGGPSNAVNDITIGALASENGFSIVNRGNILLSGAQGGVSAIGFDVEGVVSKGTIYTSSLPGGFWNDGGDIRVSAQDATATALRIGDHGVVASILNGGDIAVFTADSTSRTIDDFIGELGGSGYGLVVESLGSLSSFENSGEISVDVSGPNSSAYGVVDHSGTLTSFTNSGIINTIISDGSTGATIAVDLSSNTSGASFTNSGEITGNILIGSGNQTVSMSGGTVTGDLVFQAGAAKSGSSSLTMDGGSVTGRVNLGTGSHVVSMSNGAALTGGLLQTGGTTELSMNQSQLLLLSTSPFTTTSANISGGSTLTFNISGESQADGVSILDSSGQVTLDADTQVFATISGIIDEAETYTIIQGNSLTVGAPLSDIVTVSNSFMNNIAFSFDPSNSNAIQVTVDRKSAEDLDLGPNFSSIYNSFATALSADTPVAAALSSLQTQEEFRAGMLQLLPDTSGATLQAALNNQDMGTGMIRRRLIAVAKSGLPNHAQGDVAGFWAQALGGFAEQDAKGEQAGFSVWGLGIAIGADMPVFDNAHIGVSFMESWQSASLKVATNSPVEFFTTQLSVYGRHQNERFYSQAILSAAYNTYESARKIEFGGLERMANGDWDGFQFGASVETGTFFNWNLYQLAPYVRGAYVNVRENGYTETLGGDGINLVIADKNADSVRGSVGFTFDRDFPIFYDSFVEAEFRANYTRDIINDPFSLTADFVAGDTPFTTASNKRNPNRINMGIGVAHKDSYSSVSVDYDTEIASDYMSHTVALTMRFRF